MRKPGGYAVIFDPASPSVAETDTFTCSHCNGIVFVKPRQDPSEMGGFCQLCYGHTCKYCSEIGKCDPFEKKLERLEARDRNVRARAGLKY